MTQEELDEIMTAAGVNNPDRRADEISWADKQMTNVPKVDNPLPEPSIDDFQLVSSDDRAILDVANRLNSLLGNDFSKDIKIERLK